MSTAGLGLMKSHQIPISTVAGDTLTDRRRGSITDPSLHAHSTPSQVSPPTHSPAAHDQPGGRSYTLPSFRELSRHSKNSVFVSQSAQSPNALQPPSHSLDHVSADPAAAPRRGSAADLDHILLSSNSDFGRPSHTQPAADQPVSPTARLSLSDPQINYPPLAHSHPSHSQPYSFNSFSFDSSVPSVHLPSHPSNTPVSPRSFSSAPLSDPNLLPVGTGPNRRPTSVRRRSSRANELDVTPSEESGRALMTGPGATHNGSEHARAVQTTAGSQWPYPAPHHRHHLQKPSATVKRRGSSQSIPESSVPPSNCFGIPPDQFYGPVDQPWNAFRLMTNHSQREAVGDTSSVLRNYRLDARRQSEASSVSSTGLSYDRRQSGESGECDGTDDNCNLPPIDSLRRRSWSSSSKQSGPPFSPNQTTVCMSDYALPPLPYKEQTGPTPGFTTTVSGEHVVLADSGGWYNSLDDTVRCGEDVYDLKDKLAATRLLDRLPAPEGTVPCGPGMGQVNQQDKPSNPYSRSPELKISHKLAERKRRKEMRDLFDELRDVLPEVDERHSKGSKWETLSRAVDYMQQLKLENEKLRTENTELQRQVDPTNRGVLNSREGLTTLK